MKVQMMLIKIDYINSSNMYLNKNLLYSCVWHFLYVVKRFGVLVNSQERTMFDKSFEGKNFHGF